MNIDQLTESEKKTHGKLVQQVEEATTRVDEAQAREQLRRFLGDHDLEPEGPSMDEHVQAARRSRSVPGPGFKGSKPY